MASTGVRQRFPTPTLGGNFNNKINNCEFWEWPANRLNHHLTQDPLKDGLKCHGDQLNLSQSPFDLAFDLSHYDKELQQVAENSKSTNTFQSSYNGGDVGNDSILSDDPFANNLRLDSLDNLLLPTLNNWDLTKRPTNTSSVTPLPSFSSLVLYQHPKPKTGQRTLVARGSAYYQRFGWQSIDPVDAQWVPRFRPINYNNFGTNDISVVSRPPPPPSEDIDHVDYNTGKGYHQNHAYRKMECLFCKNLASEKDNYQTHWLKDTDRRITCPILRAYNCPICNNGGGDNAHTKRYCPKKREKDYAQCLGVFRRNFWQKY